MIKKLEWDTIWFKKKIGALVSDEFSKDMLISDLEEAKREQYKYIICHLKSPQPETINLLENQNFYLSDISIIWNMSVGDYLSRLRTTELDSHAKTSEALVKDIPELQEMIKPMFPNSRFYSDPFFSHEEADNLHVVWIKNSVLGKAADLALQIPGKGFVTCKKKENKVGEVILIGVKGEFRGKNLGKVLMNSSVEWFSNNGIKTIKIKTQLKNIPAMNFYRKLGFSIDGYEMTFSYVM
tara:strand:- start:1655 stop:2371 length:717 start_codon:yes stop_codon:yes gene_type:complete